MTGHPWRGLAFAGSSVALLAAVVRRVIRETERLLPQDAAALLDPALPFRLVVEVHRANASFFLWATVGVVGDLARLDRRRLGVPPRPSTGRER